MCGIVGYAGDAQAAPILLDGLGRLEYRGYDSAGICVENGTGLRIEKAKGRLQVLRDRTKEGTMVPGTCGIGHTRWATHGAPSDANSHPHRSCSGKIVVVHNGIIENYAALRQELEARGIGFRSDTDTEVIANLIGCIYEENGDFPASVRQALGRLEGSYALGILCEDCPGTAIAVKMHSPLIFGFGEGENFIASDVPAILRYTREVAYLDDGEMAIFDKNTVRFLNAEGEITRKPREIITWESGAAERCGYAHFMLKEIFEQPRTLRDTVLPRLKDGSVRLEGVDFSAGELKSLRKIHLIACGSAYYVSVLAKYILEKACRIPVEATMASEFRYCDPVVDGDTLVIAVSQSGETADTLAALREAKRLGAKTLAIVNVVGSAIAKAADHVIYTWAGPEIAVATTKAFTAQLSVIDLLALQFAETLGTLPPAELGRMRQALLDMPERLEAVLQPERVERIHDIARKHTTHRDAFFIGRNLDSALCMEGSLKLKEVAYLHCEAYPAGELKHGPISLIEDGTLVIALATDPRLFDKTMSNVKEVKARGAYVLCVSTEELAERAAEAADDVITVPGTHPMLQPGLALIPLQLLAYYMAVERGCDVDKPRNLAKSVTVE